MTDDQSMNQRGASRARTRWLGPIAVVAVMGVFAWVVFVGPAVDRAMRTIEVPGITSATAVHTAPDGRVVVTESGDASGPNGRVLVVDPATGQSEVVLDDLANAQAADMSANGLVCVVLDAQPPDDPELRCSDGRTVALVLRGTPTETSPVDPRDVIWDGESGWYLADGANNALLHVDPTGGITVLAEVGQVPYFPSTLDDLARTTDNRVLASLGSQVIYIWPASDRHEVFAAFDGTTVGIAPATSATLVLVREANTNVGLIASCCGGAEHYTDTILDGVNGPRGLALLPDGRLAIAADGKVLLYRSDLLDGTAR